jgi:hypothetical protein
MLGAVRSAAKRVAGAFIGNDYPRRIKYGIDPRANYGYIVYQAADLARRLGEKRISVLEFGVAGGRGLLALEDHARRVSAITGVEIEVYGFDTGEGLPPPVDYRDLPYIWQAAHFRMDVPALQAKLERAKLVLGLVSDTVKTFAETFNPAPIGAISFDLDYYSSTVDAFGIFEIDAKYRLPRVMVYFDDIVSSDLGHVGPGVGVPLAINEFNAASKTRVLSPLNHLEYKYAPSRAWHRLIYSFADFRHPQHDQYIVGSDRQLAI